MPLDALLTALATHGATVSTWDGQLTVHQGATLPPALLDACKTLKPALVAWIRATCTAGVRHPVLHADSHWRDVEEGEAP
jgi:hypothetical protein